MNIIMVRHGQTDWNNEQRYQGHQDIPLNEFGRQQARVLANTLQNETIEAVYCSDLCRAKETAEIIASPLALEVYPDPRLREMSFGLWEGRTFTEIYRDYPDQFEEWFRHTSDYTVPGGESVNLLLKRFKSFLQDIYGKYTGTVLLVTHGGVMRSFLYSILGQDPRELWENALEPGTLIKLMVDGDKVQVLQR